MEKTVTIDELKKIVSQKRAAVDVSLWKSKLLKLYRDNPTSECGIRAYKQLEFLGLTDMEIVHGE